VAKAADLPSSTLGGYLSGRHLPPVTRPAAFTTLLTVLGVAPAEHSAWLAALHRAHQRRGATHTLEPYRGLEAFRVADREVFFGRDADIAALRSLVDGSPEGVIVVLGASGSGKSSLVQAGLMAALGPDWTTAILRPGADLGAGLDALPDSAIAEPVPALARPDSLDAQPDSSPAPTAGHHLLVIDQFEELWTRSTDDEARARVSGRLAALAERPGQRVLLAVRSDFFGELSAVPEFVDALRHRTHLVSTMGAVGLAEAITGPAELVGLTCDPALVDRILRDLSAGGHDLAGALPHLSHTLRLTWEISSRRQLTLADYEAVGGVTGALARSGEIAYAALSPTQQEIAQPLLLRLVVIGEDQTPTGGSVPIDGSFDEDDFEVLDHFATHRLLSMDDEQARFSHEAVLSAWDRLVGWIDAAKARLTLEQLLDRESRAWLTADRDPGLLLRGVRLDSAQSWVDDPQARRTPERTAYVEASLAAQQAEAGESSRRLRRTRALLAAVSVAAVAALAATTMAVSTSRSRAAERNTALAGQLAAESARFAPSDPMVSRELAVAAFRQESTLQTRAAVIGATGTPTMTTLPLPLGNPALGADPKGPYLAMGTTGATFQVVDVSAATPKVVATPTAPAASASGADDSIDDFAWGVAQPVLAVVSAGGAGLAYDLSDPAAPIPMGSFTVPSYASGGIAISPDGTQLAVGTREDGIHLFALDRTAHTVTPLTVVASDKAVTALTYAPDGRIVTGAPGGFITLRDAGPEHAVIETSKLGDGRVWCLRVSGDAVYAGTLLENIAYRIPLGGEGFGPWSKIVTFDSWINDVTVSPDGRFVTFVSSDGTARTADTTGRLIGSSTMPDALIHGSYLSDGRLALGVATGQVVLRGTWEPAAADPTKKLFATAWSTDGKTLLTVPDAPGNEMRVWDVSDVDNPKVRQVLDGVPDGVQIVGAGDLSPDGTLIVGGGLKGHVVGWRQQADGRWVRTFATSLGSTVIESLRFADDTHVFYVDDDNRALLVDVSGPDAVVSQSFEGVEALPLVAATVPGKGLYAAGLDSGETLLWAAGSAAPIATIPGEGTTYGLDFSRDGSRLVVAGQSGHIRLFDVSTPSRPRLLEDLVGATAGLQSVDFAEDGSIAGAVADGSAVIFRPGASGHQLLARLPSAARLFTVRWSPDGTRLAGVGMKATALIWTVDPGAAADQICGRLGTPMTKERWASLLPGIAYRKAC
jgi:WD40 repeat protein